jgi:hypothetical protein
MLARIVLLMLVTGRAGALPNIIHIMGDDVRAP